MDESKNQREILLSSRDNLIKQNGVLDEIDTNLNNEFTNDLDRIKFIDRLQNKINKLTDIGILVQFKYSDLKFWYDFFNIFIIIISAILTVIEAIKNEVDYENSPDSIKYLFKIAPILIATIITLLGTILKFKKYQDDLELMAKALEKSIITVYRMKKLQENLHFADQTKIEVIQSMYIDEIFLLYNQSTAEMKHCITFKEQMHYKSKTAKYIPKDKCSMEENKAKSNNPDNKAETIPRLSHPFPRTPNTPIDSMMTQTQNYIPITNDNIDLQYKQNYEDDYININAPLTTHIPPYVIPPPESPTIYRRSNPKNRRNNNTYTGLNTRQNTVSYNTYSNATPFSYSNPYTTPITYSNPIPYSRSNLMATPVPNTQNINIDNVSIKTNDGITHSVSTNSAVTNSVVRNSVATTHSIVPTQELDDIDNINVENNGNITMKVDKDITEPTVKPTSEENMEDTVEDMSEDNKQITNI